MGLGHGEMIYAMVIYKRYSGYGTATVQIKHKQSRYKSIDCRSHARTPGPVPFFGFGASMTTSTCRLECGSLAVFLLVDFGFAKSMAPNSKSSGTSLCFRLVLSPKSRPRSSKTTRSLLSPASRFFEGLH